MAFYVRKTENNRNNINNKLIDRYFKVAPNNAEGYNDDTFQKVWDNEEHILALTEEEITVEMKKHDKKIHDNLVKAFAPLARFC